MIVPKLMGRMGNQNFQIATAVGYARKHGIEYCIPKNTIAPNIWPNYWAHISTKHNEGLRDPVLLRETAHSYQELPAPIEGKDIVLEGYWQSEKYFNHCREEILDLFMPKWEMNKGCVSVHIRLGDYLLHADKHPVITESYLDRATSFFTSKGYKKFKIFSDDIPGCRIILNELNLDFLYNIEYSENKEPLQDLIEMAACEHNIIANSSFSWWGAWLNRNPDKIVVAPKVWFGSGNSHLSTVDLIPESWVIL